MNKIATALALIAMTAGSLVATESMSFAATRHGKRPVAQKTIARKKGGKSHRLAEGSLFARRKPTKKVRRHRKGSKNETSSQTNPIV